MTQVAMKSIDMHCDTLMHAYFHHGEDADIYHMPEAMVDIRRLREGGALAQFFAIFVPSQWEDRDWHGWEPVSQEDYIQGCVRILERTIRAHGDAVAPALHAEDILSNRTQGKLSAVLTMEDGGMALTGLWFLAENLRFRWKLRRRRRSCPVEGCPVPVYLAEGWLASPCLVGLLRPAIYLTPAAGLE